MEIPQPPRAICFSIHSPFQYKCTSWHSDEISCAPLCALCLSQFSLHPFSYLHTYIFLSASPVTGGLTSTEQRKRITSLKPTGNILPNVNSHSSQFFHYQQTMRTCSAPSSLNGEQDWTQYWHSFCKQQSLTSSLGILSLTLLHVSGFT